MENQNKIARLAFISSIPFIPFNIIIALSAFYAFILGGVGWGPDYSYINLVLIFIIWISLVFFTRLAKRKDKFATAKPAVIVLCLTILPLLIQFSFEYFIQKTTITLSPTKITMGSHQINIQDFQGDIAISKDRILQTKINTINNAVLSPDGRWIFIVVLGGDKIHSYSVGWLYNTSSRKLLRPVAYNSNGIDIKGWRNNNEVVFNRSNVVNIYELPEYPKILKE